MSGKDEHAAMLSTEHARAAKQDYILKGPQAMTFSAQMPAYAYTSLCPDPKLREPLVKRRKGELSCEKDIYPL